MGSLLPDTSWLMAPPAPQVAQEDSKRASNHPKPIHTIDSILNGSLNNQREQEFALPSAGVMQYSSKSIPLAQSAPNQTAQGFALPPVGFGQNSSNVVPIFRPVPLLHSRNSAFTLTKTAIALPARRSTGTAKQTRNARPREPTRLLQDAPNHGRQQQPPAVATPGSSIFPHPSLLHHYHMSYMQFGLHQLNCAVLASQHNALLWNATNSSIARAPAVLPLPPSRVDSTPSTRLGQHLTTFPQTGPKHVFNPQTSRAPSFVNVTGFTEHQIIRKPNPFGPPSFNQLCSTTAQPPPTTRSSSDASNELESSTNHAQHQATILDPPLSTSVHTPLITRITSDASNELAPNRREPLESLTRPAIGAESNLLSYIEHLPPTPFIQLPDAGRTEPDTLTLNQAQPIDQPVFIEPRSSPENIIAPAAPTPVPILEPPPLCLPLFIDTSAPGPSHRAPLPSPASAFAMLDRAQKTRAKSHRSLNRFWKCQFRWRRDSRKACSWSKREEAEYKRRTQDKLDRHNLRMERADREEQEARAILCLSPLSPNAPMPQLPFVLRKKAICMPPASPMISSDMNNNALSQVPTTAGPASSTAVTSQPLRDQQSTNQPRIPKLVLKRLNSSAQIPSHCDTWQIKKNSSRSGGINPGSIDVARTLTLASMSRHIERKEREARVIVPTTTAESSDQVLVATSSVLVNGCAIKTEGPEPDNAQPTAN